MHLDLDGPVPFADLTSSARYVEGEPARFVTAGSSFGRGGEESPDVVEHLGVGRRVGTWGPADRRLVDVDHLVDVLQAFDPLMPSRHDPRPVQLRPQSFGEDVLDQSRLPGAGHPRHGDEQAQRNLHVDASQVVLGGTDDSDRLSPRLPPPLRHGDAASSRQVVAGDGVRFGDHILQCPRDDDVAAVLTSSRTDVDDVVGSADRVLVVLDDDEGVAQIPQSDEGLDEALVVPLVETDRRFVEDVEDPDQA